MNTDLSLLASRRAGLAALLGTLVLEEPGHGVAELVRGVPALAALAREDSAVCVEYERVFLRGVPLYESGFRSEDGQHGGPALGAVVERYDRVGFSEHRDARWRVAGADHLGLELRCYAALCAEEAEAWRSDTADVAMATVEAERSFLSDHLSAWAPVAVRAATRIAGDGPYRPLFEAVEGFLAEEHDRLRPAPALGAPLPIEDLPEHVGPARLARLLLAPARAGMWLSPADIEPAARAIGVPWRRSDTRTSLRHVIEAAIDEDELAAVLGALRPAVAGAGDEYRARAGSDGGNAAHWLAWADRASAMVTRLDRIIANGLFGESRTVAAWETISVSGVDPVVLADAVDEVVARLRGLGFRVDRAHEGPEDHALG